MLVLSALTHLDSESVPMAVQYVASLTAELRCYVSLDSGLCQEVSADGVVPAGWPPPLLDTG